MQLIFLLIEYISLIFCELYTWSREFNYDVNLKYCLFGGVKFTKNADLCINTHIVVMVLDSIRDQNFNYLMVAWVKMSLFLELI